MQVNLNNHFIVKDQYNYYYIGYKYFFYYSVFYFYYNKIKIKLYTYKKNEYLCFNSFEYELKVIEKRMYPDFYNNINKNANKIKNY